MRKTTRESKSKRAITADRATATPLEQQWPTPTTPSGLGAPWSRTCCGNTSFYTSDSWCPMRHAILGEIHRTADASVDGVATVRYGPRDLKIQMFRDNQSFETTLKLAAEARAEL